METCQWDWRMRYYDTTGYFRTFSAGYNAGIHLQKDVAFPPGYRVANGQKGGCYTESGAKTRGDEPIKMQPPPSGNGILKFVTLSKIVVKNTGTSHGHCAYGLGVADVNGPSFPMWPYIGCGHDLDINQLAPITVPANSTIEIHCDRYDMVDEAFMSGADEITTWPNWEMKPNDGNKLWPAVTPIFKNTGNCALQVGGVFIIAYPIP